MERIPIPALSPDVQKIARAQSAKRFRFLRSLYPSTPWKAIAQLEWDDAKRMSDIEVHTTIVHLDPLTLAGWGLPVFDCELLRKLRGDAHIERFRQVVLTMILREQGEDSFSLAYIQNLRRVVEYLDGAAIELSPFEQTEKRKLETAWRKWPLVREGKMVLSVPDKRE